MISIYRNCKSKRISSQDMTRVVASDTSLFFRRDVKLKKKQKGKWRKRGPELALQLAAVHSEWQLERGESMYSSRSAVLYGIQAKWTEDTHQHWHNSLIRSQIQLVHIILYRLVAGVELRYNSYKRTSRVSVPAKYIQCFPILHPVNCQINQVSFFLTPIVELLLQKRVFLLVLLFGNYFDRSVIFFNLIN